MKKIVENWIIEYKNEKEIKECKIEINNIKIPFCYTYKFGVKGKYIIKYIFDKSLTKTNNMFSGCSYLIKLDLSNFNTENVTDMGFMFNRCYKLTEIIGINKFNINKVNSMTAMFQESKELEYIELPNFKPYIFSNIGLKFKKCKKIKILKGIHKFISY